jgi:hypothetical protein
MQDPAQLMSIARTLQDVDLSKIAFLQYPTTYTEGFAAVVPAESAAAVNTALQADVPVQIDPNATSNTDFGTVPDPNAPPPQPETPAATDPSDTPAPDATPSPSATPGEVLPPDVTGQTAAEVRCSSTNGG